VQTIVAHIKELLLLEAPDGAILTEKTRRRIKSK